MLVVNKISKVTLSALLTLCAMSTLLAEPVQNELLKVANKKASGIYVRTRFLQAMKKPINPKAIKKALIIGDSHAQDFFNSVLENNYLKNYQITTRYIPTRCQISYLGKKGKQYIAQKDKALCATSDDLSQAKEAIAKADLIILVSKWRRWAAKELPQTIKNLAITQQQKLIVIGGKSFGRVTIRKYLRMPDNKLRSLRNEIDGNQHEINEIMKKSLSANVFVNTHHLICGTSSTCPVFTQDLKLISFDGGHLTKEGARYVGNILFQSPVLGGFK
jgi:hypothetical protein